MGVAVCGCGRCDVEGLVFRGGQHGIGAANGADSDGVVLNDIVAIGNSHSGVAMDTSNDAWTVVGSRFESNSSYGLWSRSMDAVFEGNTFVGNGEGLHSAGVRTRIVGNEAFANNSWGFSVGGSGGVANRVLVEDNVAVGNRHGIALSGNAVLGSGNRTWSNNFNGLGVYDAAVAQWNDVWNNGHGVDASNATVRENVVYGNRGDGIGQWSSRIESNRVYDNAGIGINGVYGW
ncbi:MAG: right-handed parallel beta-helix repeat-containing protein [Betaproteobacteria bacterium]|nr:right-handed parallel beta-helix repeat-containing protein [Betaproteobacteria bacterium]